MVISIKDKDQRGKGKEGEISPLQGLERGD
jgi:hypothetical protein